MPGHRRLASALALASLAAVAAARARPAAGGVLDLSGSLEHTSTAWDGDHGGGGTLHAGWFFRPWIAATFIGREHYAVVDERVLSYFSVNASVRQRLGATRLTASAGLVHQHEEPTAAIADHPVQALLGVGDGIRHRAGVRGGLDLSVPFRRHRHGDFFASASIDATWFGDDHGPGWQVSAGLGLGFTYDFARRR